MTRGKVSVTYIINYIEGSESSAFMTDVEKLQLGVKVFIEPQTAGLKGKMGKALFLFLLLISAGG